MLKHTEGEAWYISRASGRYRPYRWAASCIIAAHVTTLRAPGGNIRSSSNKPSNPLRWNVYCLLLTTSSRRHFKSTFLFRAFPSHSARRRNDGDRLSRLALLLVLEIIKQSSICRAPSSQMASRLRACDFSCGVTLFSVIRPATTHIASYQFEYDYHNDIPTILRLKVMNVISIRLSMTAPIKIWVVVVSPGRANRGLIMTTYMRVW